MSKKTKAKTKAKTTYKSVLGDMVENVIKDDYVEAEKQLKSVVNSKLRGRVSKAKATLFPVKSA